MYEVDSGNIQFFGLEINGIKIRDCEMQITSTCNEIRGVLTIDDDVASYNDLHLSENDTVRLCGLVCISYIPKDVDKYIKIKNVTNLGGKEYENIEIKCSVDGIKKEKDTLEINVVLLVL